MTHDIEYIDKMVIGMFSKIKVYFFAKSSIRVAAASDNTIMKIIHNDTIFLRLLILIDQFDNK